VLTVALHAEHDTVKVGDAIVLRATLTNQSDHEIAFGYDRNRDIVTVDVVDEGGKFAQDRRPGYRNGTVDLELLSRVWSPEQLAKSGLLSGHFVDVRVKPGGTFLDGYSFDVSKFYDMAQPGIYTIIVECIDPESGARVWSNPIRVAVAK
jgi:hypothetical protein